MMQSDREGIADAQRRKVLIILSSVDYIVSLFRVHACSRSNVLSLEALCSSCKSERSLVNVPGACQWQET